MGTPEAFSQCLSLCLLFHPLRSCLQRLVLGMGEMLCLCITYLSLPKFDLLWHLPWPTGETISQHVVWVRLVTLFIWTALNIPKYFGYGTQGLSAHS